MNFERVVERIRAEFEEMPELKLTLPQASRFFGLDQATAQSVMERLLGSAYLRMARDGTLVKAAR